MTGAAPGDETGRTPTAIPADGSQVAGEAPEGTDEGTGDSSVLVSYCYNSRVSHSWHQSMMNMIAYDKTLGLNVINALPFAVHCSGPNSLVEGRNMAVEYFLDQTEHEWLFFVDTDMGFKPESLEALLLAADPVQRPVVGGLCFALKHMVPDGSGGFVVRPVPTLFMWAKNPQQGFGFANRFIYPPETMVQVAGTGAAFLLMHRSALEAVRAKFGPVWFNLVQYSDGTQVSEDLSFCYRLGELQIPVFVHTGVKTTHHKEFWLGEKDYAMPDHEPMALMMAAAKDEQSVVVPNRAERRQIERKGATLNHEGSDRWTGGDRKDEQ